MVAECILLVVVIRFAARLRTFVDSSEWMHYTLPNVSRKNFHISPFSGSWTRYSAFSVILDEKLWSFRREGAIADRSVHAVADRCSEMQVNGYSETGYT